MPMPLEFRSVGDACCAVVPGGHVGMCLFGTGVGLREWTFRLRDGETGGGVGECRTVCGCTTIVAIPLTIVAPSKSGDFQVYAGRAFLDNHSIRLAST